MSAATVESRLHAVEIEGTPVYLDVEDNRNLVAADVRRLIFLPSLSHKGS